MEHKERVKIFSRTEIIAPHKNRNENGFDYDERMKKVGKEIQLLDCEYANWLKENPSVEVIKTELQTHLGVAQASTSFMYAANGWMCHVANLLVTYRENQSAE